MSKWNNRDNWLQTFWNDLNIEYQKLIDMNNKNIGAIYYQITDILAKGPGTLKRGIITQRRQSKKELPWINISY